MDNSIEQPNKRGRGRDKSKRQLHPNSLKNLQGGRWKPGQSGNPAGLSLTGLVKLMLDEIPNVKIGDKINTTKAWRQLIVDGWLVGSYKGNAVYFKELLERTEGKVPLPVTGGEGEPLMPQAMQLILADGTEVIPGRMGGNGNKGVKVETDGDGHKGS